ncbi:MAG: hypothetical protein A3B53_00495 [Candidatus Levybacteria bacterium RIFCSPLOWO2_01_FULL_42_15]|nr:MAG: hypothetical protein A3B53_00495 [Candidatus Levybacteria bacterium RIFCSPLOWO2_01_FULL_42_15]
MRIFIAIILIALAAIGTWDLRDGALDMLPGEQYGSVKSQTKNLPFEVKTPSHILPGFKFQKKESLAFFKENPGGIPQVNLFFQSDGGKNEYLLKQHDRARYESEALAAARMPDFETYFAGYRKMEAVQRNGKTIYVTIPTAKTRTAFGDLEYAAAGAFVTVDSVVELDYFGEDAISEEEMLKVLLSL